MTHFKRATLFLACTLFFGLSSTACIPIYRLGNGGMRLGPVELTVKSATHVAPIFRRNGRFLVLHRSLGRYQLRIQNRTTQKLHVMLWLHGKRITPRPNETNTSTLDRRSFVLYPKQRKVLHVLRVRGDKSLQKPSRFVQAHPETTVRGGGKIKLMVWRTQPSRSVDDQQLMYRLDLSHNTCEGYKRDRICLEWCPCHRSSTKQQTAQQPPNHLLPVALKTLRELD